MNRFFLIGGVIVFIGVGVWAFFNLTQTPSSIPDAESVNTTQGQNTQHPAENPATRQTLVGIFTYNSNRSIPGRFYIGSNTSGAYIAFRDQDEAMVSSFGINRTAPIGDSCEWIVPATVEISGRAMATVDTLQADAAALLHVLSKGTATQKCPTRQSSSQADATFSATPITGSAAFSVRFTSTLYATHDANEPQHSVDFGDGTEKGRITCINSTGTDLGNYQCSLWGIDHTYTTSGTYTAKLVRDYNGQTTVLKTTSVVVR